MNLYEKLHDVGCSQTPSDAVNTGCEWQSTNLDLQIHTFQSWNQRPCTAREYTFSGFPKWTCNLHLIFPTNSWELRHIRWHGTTSHPQPCGSCDNGPPTSKSSLDQTTASCTVAKKQSPKYVYPRRRALMLIKMNDSNQLMWTCTYRTGERNIKMESSTEPRLHKPELCRGN